MLYFDSLPLPGLINWIVCLSVHFVVVVVVGIESAICTRVGKVGWVYILSFRPLPLYMNLGLDSCIRSTDFKTDWTLKPRSQRKLFAYFCVGTY